MPERKEQDDPLSELARAVTPKDERERLERRRQTVRLEPGDFGYDEEDAPCGSRPRSRLGRIVLWIVSALIAGIWRCRRWAR